MSCAKRLDAAFTYALNLPFDRNTSYVIFSDCHRGVGNKNDNFLKNEPLFLAAMKYYMDRGFTYVELGDGDELWENRSMKKIREMHSHSFELLEAFEKRDRMYEVYGNHDMVKKRDFLCESIVLKDREAGKDIYLTHGHQADTLNSTLWGLARFLVRYVWRPLESLGIPDPTSAAKNNTKREKAEQKLAAWAKDRGRILVTGHTHRPSAGTPSLPYFNAGSCVHPGGITGIEIAARRITLVKWSMKARTDMNFYAAREVLGDPVSVDDIL